MGIFLIAGSRHAHPAMVDYARKAVGRIAERGDSIIVGDALGIDEAVASEAYRLGVDCTVVGITERPRHGIHSTAYLKVGNGLAGSRGIAFQQYLHRDAYMAQQASLGLFIWNGTSNGTIIGYNRMKAMGGKLVYLATYDAGARTITISDDTSEVRSP